MCFPLSDTCFLIIPQYSLLTLNTPIKYGWVPPPPSVLPWLSWTPVSKVVCFYDVKLPSIRSHLICSLPGHPAWRCCVPVAVAARWDALLSYLLIKAVIRPNPGLQMSSSVSQVCQAALEDEFSSFTDSLALSQFTYLCATVSFYEIFNMMSNDWSLIPNNRL